MTDFEEKEMEGFFSSSHEWCLIRQAVLGLQPRDKPGGGGGGVGGIRIWKGWDARRKFWIKPLKETDLGVVQAFFDP